MGFFLLSFSLGSFLGGNAPFFCFVSFCLFAFLCFSLCK